MSTQQASVMETASAVVTRPSGNADIIKKKDDKKDS